MIEYRGSIEPRQGGFVVIKVGSKSGTLANQKLASIRTCTGDRRISLLLRVKRFFEQICKRVSSVRLKPHRPVH